MRCKWGARTQRATSRTCKCAPRMILSPVRNAFLTPLAASRCILGASLVPPRWLLGASLVPPRRASAGIAKRIQFALCVCFLLVKESREACASLTGLGPSPEVHHNAPKMSTAKIILTVQLESFGFACFGELFLQKPFALTIVSSSRIKFRKRCA